MQNKKVVEVVTQIASPIVEKHSFELVDTELVKEGSNWYLRIYIDKPGGITIDDCQLVSEELGAALDKIDIIEQSYFFEISSPGLERPLKKDKDFEKYSGQIVDLKLYKPINGIKEFEGMLVGLVDGYIIIKTDKNIELKFDRESVAIVKRALKF